MKRNDVNNLKKMHDDRGATGNGRRLSLHRETLRRLRADELRHADGGRGEWWLASIFRACDI